MKKYGLIGLPLVHSFSQKYFTAKFEKESIDAQYDLYELNDISEFADLVTNTDICGLNVTIPYKEKVIPFLNDIDLTAKQIGAVNVIKFKRSEGQLHLTGYNSDAIGFENSIKPHLKNIHKKALILGTGGASKAIFYVLKKLNFDVLFVSRTAGEGKITYTELTEKVIKEHLLIVNASPVGTFPHSNECPDIPYEFLTEDHLLYDVVYNPAETIFLKNGKAKGATTINGEGMLEGQALAAWEIWNR